MSEEKKNTIMLSKDTLSAALRIWMQKKSQ